jgi:cob(I)alamin adenosyltransferase
MRRPRVLLFTGDGKGKTTAALGLALRAAGHGQQVRIIQFIKADARTGELNALRALPQVSIVQSGHGFMCRPDGGKLADHRAAAREGLSLVRQALADPGVGVVVLDEICWALTAGLLEEADLLAALGTARTDTIVVLTGRGAPDSLVAAADTVTEMRCEKHAYQQGLTAQEGVEW